MESCRAKSSENKSKNCKNHIFHVCFSFCGYLLWAPAPQKQGGNVRYSKKTTWSYSILLCMKTVLQWFRGQSGTYRPSNQHLKNVHVELVRVTEGSQAVPAVTSIFPIENRPHGNCSNFFNFEDYPINPIWFFDNMGMENTLVKCQDKIRKKVGDIKWRAEKVLL